MLTEDIIATQLFGKDKPTLGHNLEVINGNKGKGGGQHTKKEPQESGSGNAFPRNPRKTNADPLSRLPHGWHRRDMNTSKLSLKMTPSWIGIRSNKERANKQGLQRDQETTCKITALRK